MLKKFNKIKKGDYVQILTGTEKSKKGKIITINSKKNTVIIEGLNLKTKHFKSKHNVTQGVIKRLEHPIHYSNIKKII